jgi:hypothetical protein
LLLALAALNPTVAWGQQDSTPIIKVTDQGASTELSARDEKETRTNGEENSFESNRLDFEQLLRYWLNGFSYHPRLLEFTAGLELRMLQEFTLKSYRLLPGGQLRLNFLKDKPYGLNLRGSLSRGEVERSFARNYRIASEAFGASFRYSRPGLRLTTGYDHSATRRTYSDLTRLTRRDTVDARLAYKKDTKGEYKLVFSEIDERKSRQQVLTMTTRKEFDKKSAGAAGRKRLDGSLRLAERGGQDERQLYTLYSSGGFVWRHLKTLVSRHRVQVEGNHREGDWAVRGGVTSALEHQLYESLTSTGTLHADFENASQGSIRRMRASAAEIYTKKLPGEGRLNITLSPGVQLIQNRPTQSAGLVFREAHVVTDIAPSVLVQLNPVLESVVVRNAANDRVYMLDLDYTLTSRGPTVELSRVVTGDIADGDTILVDYEYLLDASYDALTTNLASSVRVTPGYGLAFYARYLVQSQTLLAGDFAPELRDQELRVLGVEYKNRWLSTEATVQQALGSFESMWGHSERLGLTSPILWGLRFRGAAVYSARHYENGESFAGASASGGLSGSLRRWSAETKVDYRRERWTGSMDRAVNNLDAFGARAILRRSFRATHVEVHGRITRIQSEQQIQNVQVVKALIRRTF